jgi:hypothetical protein
LKPLFHLKNFNLDGLLHDTHDETEKYCSKNEEVGAFFKELLQDLPAETMKNNENSQNDFRFLTGVWIVNLHNTNRSLTTKYPK